MKISKKLAKELYAKSIEKGLCTDDKAVIFYLKNSLDHKLSLLKKSFPSETMHAIAIKTCNHPKVLEHIIRSGLGLEAASIEEVFLAKASGADNTKIVFDSPVKTKKEIEYCHKELPGILLNANSLEEIDRFPANFRGKIGLRINPLVDNSGGHFFNVSTSTSKFGVPINREKDIINTCLKHPEISCLHVHIGSNLSNFEPNIKAIELVTSLAKKINALRIKMSITNLIETIDIGGGIDFEPNKGNFTIDMFVDKISNIPDLFESFNLVTEFGNFIHKSNSFVVSNIEYVISNSDGLPNTAYLHVGADLFVRKAYSNMNIQYPYSILHTNKEPGEKELVKYNIVGPLCFAGDILFENIELPKINEGDKMFIYEIGANTLSMWSGHCSREQPTFIFL
jgi:diaminopimelate decarboxylase